MANPRKFSEKIALQKQREADGTAEFERIMQLVHDTKKDESQCLANTDVGNHSSLVASSAAGGVGGGASGGAASPDGLTGGCGSSGSPTTYRESRGRSVGVGPMRRPSERKQDRSPYGSSNSSAIPSGISMSNNAQNIAYLSPPIDSSWRRSNSDSALHQSLNMAVAAEGGFSPGGVSSVGGISGDMNSLHANYQHHNQRSHSSNVGRSLSPHTQRKKGNILQQQGHNHHHQQQHHMQIQQQQHQHHDQQLQQHLQQQQHMHLQQHHQQLHYNSKFLNCNMPVNSMFKSLQDQSMTFANTGSLPDLTSVHYAAPTQQQMIHQQQQQLNLSPILSPHNNGHERDQSSSPFSPPGGGPASPYSQQQHSPTSVTTTPTAAQTSPHLSFTNLAVQSPNAAQNSTQTGSFSNLPTLGAAASTGNLTDYRQPLNPPSPGSSPGLLTSISGNELHTSAPASPMRHNQAKQQQIMQGFNDKNIPTYGRYSPVVDSSYNILNTSFHNHFEHISLIDSNSSPEQQQLQHFQQPSNCSGLDFGGFRDNDQQQNYSQNKLLDFNNLRAHTVSTATRNVSCKVSSSAATTVVTTCNNNHLHQSGRSISQQQLLNNNTTHSTNTNGHCSANNNTALSQQNDAAGVLRQDVLASPVPSPLGCAPPPSAPLPIPISSQSPHHHNHQLSISLHSQSAQHSPHHSPVQSPHQVSPLSASSPGITTLGISTSVASIPDTSNMANAAHNQQVQHQQQSHASTPTTTNIPSIFLSDYSIFDTLDLDLGQMDVAGLQMLDQNTIMIADPTVEDSFRRDLN